MGAVDQAERVTVPEEIIAEVTLSNEALRTEAREELRCEVNEYSIIH